MVIEELTFGDPPRSPGADMAIPAGESDVKIRFTALSFISPDRIQFKYKLEGLPTDWRTTTNREIPFQSLSPGRYYTFRVMAANADGVWNESGAALVFYKTPFFYETSVFYGFCIFVVGAAIVGGTYLRLRQHAARERELTRRIDEAVTQIKRLQGMIPICAWCKKVRTDAGSWQQVEVYVRNHTEATFSHGICPDCQSKLEGEIAPNAAGGNRPAKP